MQDIRASLKRAGETYFDLYLMHSAIGGPEVRKEVWKALCDAQEEGWLHSIGVSRRGVVFVPFSLSIPHPARGPDSG
jgi:diketogulonate reductase-like aldo/keto reductase